MEYYLLHVALLVGAANQFESDLRLQLLSFELFIFLLAQLQPVFQSRPFLFVTSLFLHSILR